MIGVAVSKLKQRLRFSLRGLIGLVLVLGLILSLIAREDRRVRRQSAIMAELARQKVYGDGRPTWICFVAMKLFSTNSRAIEDKFSGWLDPGWFYHLDHFNAGLIDDADVPMVVESMSRLGSLKEVRYDRPPLTGLRLFYVNRPIPWSDIGVSAEAVSVIDHSPRRQERE